MHCMKEPFMIQSVNFVSLSCLIYFLVGWDHNEISYLFQMDLNKTNLRQVKLKYNEKMKT